MEMKSRVYALIDEQNRVTKIEGQYSLPDNLDGWTLIEEGESCDRLNHAQGNYLDKPIRDERGILQYKWNGKKIVERTKKEMDAEYVEPEETNSIEDRLGELEVKVLGKKNDKKEKKSNGMQKR